MANANKTLKIDHVWIGGYGESRDAHITFVDDQGESTDLIRLTPELTIQLISQLASTLK